MGRSLFLAIALGVAGAATAQTGVTLTNVLDVASNNVGSVYAATYSVSDDKFIVSNAGVNVRIYNGTTGAYESDLNISGTNPSGLGFFALTSGSDGSIFGVEVVGGALWQWDNVADTSATIAAYTVPFSRCGHVIGTGASTRVALTGSANNGSIFIYSTADDVSYALTETLPAGTPPSKSSFSINSAIDKAWSVGDSLQPITKAVKSGTWALDGGFTGAAGTAGSASQVYDNANNVVFAMNGTTVYALHGDTGADLGNLAVTNGLNATPGYAGAVVSSTPGSGTLWIAGRGATATNAALQKFTYTVTGVSAVQDWSLY